MLLDDYYVIAGDNKYSLVIGDVSIHCILQPLYDHLNIGFVGINYALRKEDSCVTFQSFGDYAQICSYNLNYVKLKTYNFQNLRYSTRMKIKYHTYLRPKTRRIRNCTNKDAGLLVRTTAPENSFLQLYDNDSYMEHYVT